MMTVWMLASIGQAWWAVPFLALMLHGSAPLYVRSAALLPASHPLSSGELPAEQFQVLLALGAFVASLAGVFLGPVAKPAALWNAYGAVAGCVLAVGHGLGVAAAELIGLPAAASVSSAAAVLSAFGFGLVVLDETVWSAQGASCALTLLLLGTALAAGATEVAHHLRGAEHGGRAALAERSPLLPFTGDERWEQASGMARFSGVLVSAAAGICSGVSLGPLALGPPGGAFLPSFGLGLLASSVLMLRGRTKVFCPPRVLISGILAGVVWMLAHAVAVLAVLKLGYARSFPIFHCQIFVVRAWEAFSGELDGRTASVCALAALLVGTGSTMLLATAHSG